MDNYDILESNKVFKGIILDVYHDKILLPNGRQAMREIVRKKSATAIVAVSNDDKILLVKQHRPAINEFMLEVPAGIFDEGESAEQCGLRELEEETGFVAGKMTFLTKMYASVGFCDELVHIYLAEDLIAGKQNFDEDEFLTVEEYALEDAIKMIFNGEIKDSKTIAGILAYREMKKT